MTKRSLIQIEIKPCLDWNSMGGMILTFYGDKFLYTTLVYQAISSSGIPSLKRSMSELIEKYKNSRNLGM